jgi:hypothetical protein
MPGLNWKIWKTALIALEKSVHQENRLFPRNAFLISKAVRKRFPS